jgi:iron uptake system component EfeO
MRVPMLTRTLVVGALVLATAGGVAGCSDSTGGVEVAVTGTKDACTPATTTPAAGKTTFLFTNNSGQVSELYVYDANDKIKGEVENVTDGTTRKLSVTLTEGATYRLACKPGQKGDGFSTTITAGPAAASSSAK